MRILIISSVPCRDDNSVGNTYNNIFKSFSGAEFANLYCKEGIPNLEIIKQPFQITEKMLLLNMINKKNIYSKIPLRDNIYKLSKKEENIYDKMRVLRFQSFFLIRDLIWKMGKWKTKELNDFLEEFSPDIIFSFCSEYVYNLNLLEYCKERTDAKLVLFFTDDIYSYTQMSPLSLCYKYYVRKRIKMIVNNSALLYGATHQLCAEYFLIFKRAITTLHKICEDTPQTKLRVNSPLKITYTGNLFYGRWKTLALIAQAIKEINMESTRVSLDIYTTSLITQQMKKALNVEGASQIVGAIPYMQVKAVLKVSDVVLHVESFEKAEIRKTRLSFSTKIIDCMQSGSCLLAVGPDNTASIQFLKEKNIALVISNNDKDEVKNCILNILKNDDSLFKVAQKMSRIATDEYSLDALNKSLYIPLETLCAEKEVCK